MSIVERTLYFAVKLVANNVGDKTLRPHPLPATAVTVDRLEVADSPSGRDRFLTIGSGPAIPIHGVGGHFTLLVLDFNEADNASCKTAAEAERLVTAKHKAWLADAYDWYIVPAKVESVSARAQAAA